MASTVRVVPHAGLGREEPMLAPHALTQDRLATFISHTVSSASAPLAVKDSVRGGHLGDMRLQNIMEGVTGEPLCPADTNLDSGLVRSSALQQVTTPDIEITGSSRGTHHSLSPQHTEWSGRRENGSPCDQTGMTVQIEGFTTGEMPIDCRYLTEESKQHHD
jgi:hypothetical protein